MAGTPAARAVRSPGFLTQKARAWGPALLSLSGLGVGSRHSEHRAHAFTLPWAPQTTSPETDNTYFPARMQGSLRSTRTLERGIYHLGSLKPTPEAGQTPRCLRRCLSSPRRTRGPCTVTGQDEGARVQPPPRLGPCPPLSGPFTVARSAQAFQGPSLHLPVTLRGPRPSTFAPHSRALSGEGGVSPWPSAPASHWGSL